MTLYENWMASPEHLKLFKLAAKLGYFLWTPMPTAVLVTPWYYWALAHNVSSGWFLVGLILLASLAAFLSISTLRHFPQRGAPVWISVEMRYGVIGVHMWKRFPDRAEMQALLVNCVRVAQDLGFKSVQIESPLFVKAGRLPLWGKAIRRILEEGGFHRATVEDVHPKKMPLPRAVLFAVIRRLRNYDSAGKHLPKPRLVGQTAGFTVKLQ